MEQYETPARRINYFHWPHDHDHHAISDHGVLLVRIILVLGYAASVEVLQAGQ